MGVIKQFGYGRTPLILRSSDESLSSAGISVPSTPPSEVEEISLTTNQRPNVQPHRRDPALLIERLEHVTRRRPGARKTRREDNDRALQTLVESNEEGDLYSIPTIDDFMPLTNSPLTRLMTDFTCMSIWQYFMAQSEEEQIKYLNDVQKRSRPDVANRGIHFSQAPAENTEGGRPQAPTLSPEQRFGLVDSSLRGMLKRRNTPVDLLSSLEKDIIEVFEDDNAAVYLSQELGSFERLLMHGISQYHLLKSWSVDMAGSRRTKVENKYALFASARITLGAFLERRIRLLNRS